MLEIERELAKERKQKAGKLFGKEKDSLGSNEHKVQRARDIVARKIGVSPTTFHRALTIIERCSEELKESVRCGRTSITYAYPKIRRDEKHQDPPSLPEEKFDVIYADPPFHFIRLRTRSRKENCPPGHFWHQTRRTAP